MTACIDITVERARNGEPVGYALLKHRNGRTTCLWFRWRDGEGLPEIRANYNGKHGCFWRTVKNPNWASVVAGAIPHDLC